MQKATQGLYKRLKKSIIDVDETERKILTGGYVDKDKLERATVKAGFAKSSRITPSGHEIMHNEYTQMDFQSNILNGNLTQAVVSSSTSYGTTRN